MDLWFAETVTADIISWKLTLKKAPKVADQAVKTHMNIWWFAWICRRSSSVPVELSVTVKRLFYVCRLFFFFHLFLFTVLFLVPGTRLPFGLSVWDPLHAFVNKLQADIQPAAEQKLSSPSRPSFIPLCDGSWWMSGVFSPLYGRQLDCAHVLLNICNITRRIWARGGIML